MFTLDTESGFRDVVFITAAYGLGETVVQGAVNPDEFYVHKPTLAAGTRGDHAPQPGRQGHPHGLRRRRRRPAPVHTEAVPRGRSPRCSAYRRRSAGAGPARHDHRRALRPAHGHRVGQGRHRRPALHPPGPAGDGEDPQRQMSCERYRLRARGRCWPAGRAIGSRIGAGTARVIKCTPRCTRSSPATCSSPR